MSKKLRVVLAQINVTVGDITGNLAKLIESANTARDQLAADVIVFPELCLTGYPPEDLLLRQSFLDAANAALNTFKTEVKDIYCVVGCPHATSKGLFNSCAVIYNGTIWAVMQNNIYLITVYLMNAAILFQAIRLVPFQSKVFRLVF